MRQQAEAYMRKALNNPVASFRDGQWESIEQLLILNSANPKTLQNFTPAEAL